MRHFKLLLFFSVLVSCSPPKEGGSSNTNSQLNLSAMLIDLPTSISAHTVSTSSLKLTPQAGTDDLVAVYEGVRSMVGLADEFGRTLSLVLGGVSSGTDITQIPLGGSFISTEINETANPANPSAIKITHNDGGSFEYSIILYWLTASAQYVPALQLNMTPTGTEQGRGEAYVDLSVLGGGGDGPSAGTLKLSFDTNDSSLGKTMTVEMAGLTFSSSSSTNPSNVKIRVSSSSDILTIYGNMHFANMGGSNPFLAGGRSYIFTGQINETSNVAVINLALPPDSLTTSDDSIFSDYSIGKVFQSGLFQNYIQSANGSSGGFEYCCCLSGNAVGQSSANICSAATTCTGSNSPPNTSCSASSITSSTLISGFDGFCTVNASNAICQSLSWVYKMNNPAYFANSGFVGTAAYNTPTSGYEGLSASNIQMDSASDIANLSVSFNSTPVSAIE